MIPTALQTKTVGRDEMKALARRVRTGDKEARERMILANSGLAAKGASRYAKGETELWDELYAEALKWVVYSVDHYDPDVHDFCFSTFAMRWIRQGLGRLLRRLDGAKAITKIVTDKGGKKKRVVVGVVRQEVSLDASSDSSESATPLKDTLVARTEDPLTLLLKTELRERVKAQVETLEGRERLVVSRLYALDGGEPQTLQMIADHLGLCRERVRQISVAALEKLRRPLQDYSED